MPEFDIDVSGIDKTLNEIKRDLHRGMEKSVDTLVENAKDRARQVITENRAIFNAEVYRGFRDAETKNTPYNVRAKLYNDVGHAEVLEDGATFPKKAPPVEALLPWVARKMRVGSSFDPDSYGGGDGFPDSFGGGDDGDGGDGDDGGNNSGDGSNTIQPYEYTSDDISVSDEVYVDDLTTQRRVVVDSKGEDSFKASNSTGSFTFDYDQISSDRIHSPVSERLDEFERGDAIEFYDRDADEYIEGVLTGKEDTFRVTKYEVIDSKTGNTIGMVPQSIFTDWEPAPDIDRSKISPEMREVNISSSEVGMEEASFTRQPVTLYNAITGETQEAEITETPWNNQYRATLQDGSNYSVDIDDDDWEIVAVRDFDSLSESEQRDYIDIHFDEMVSVRVDHPNISVASDKYKDFIKEKIKDGPFEGYRDKKKFAKVLASWSELTMSDNRAHVGSALTGGWELQMYPHPDQLQHQTERSWLKTYMHEFGHAYNRPTPASTSLRGRDPEEYKFANPWGKRDESSHSHMYEDMLPRWQFSENDPIHGYKEMYMFGEDNGSNYVSYTSTGGIQSDTRNQMDVYGVSDWGDRVQAKARADAEGRKLSTERMDVDVTELSDKQVFGPDDYRIDEGDTVAIEVDGRRVIHEVDAITEEEPFFLENPDEDVPSTGKLVNFNLKFEPGMTSMYIGEDGTAYGTKYEQSGTMLTLEGEKFIGKASVSNYDPSLDEFPDLVETDSTKRVQEAANMAWWYQANFIEFDNSPGHERSKNLILSGGYSATYAEEVMSTFTEAMAHPDPGFREELDLEIVAKHYPFFVEEFLKDRRPVTQDAIDILEQEGIDV